MDNAATRLTPIKTGFSRSIHKNVPAAPAPETANPDRVKIPKQPVDAIEARKTKVADEAAKLFGKANAIQNRPYFSYHTEVGAAQDAVRDFAAALIAANPHLINQIEAVIHSSTQQAPQATQAPGGEA